MSKIVVCVKPGSKSEKIVETDGELIIFTHARAHDGEANKAVITAVAKYFKVPKTSIKITRGLNSRVKIIEF